MNRKIFSQKLASDGSMKRKLFFYMFILVVFILIILFLILSLLDQFKTGSIAKTTSAGADDVSVC